MKEALVIGGGPAGLMAAEELAAKGRPVVLVEAKPTVGRKFLMAGKSGLNLTKDEPFEDFIAALGPDAGRLRPMLEGFSNRHVREWAEGLGQALFTGSTGRVFPKVMKASPLLRAWLQRLKKQGVGIRTGWRWQGWEGDGLVFATPEGRTVLRPSATILALGGASWSRLGSDGQWAQWLQAKGIRLAPFAPANAGLSVDWSEHMARHFGSPVKGVALRAGDLSGRGEFVVSGRGLEGGGIYAMTVPVRHGEQLFLDLVPDRSADDVAKRIARRPSRTTLTNHLRKSLRLPPVSLALLMEFGRPLPEGEALAALIKALPVRHAGLRPLDEAISTAGGVCWEELDQGLMLRCMPGVFVAGEMLDWEAPTGGYLLTASLATGKWAGAAAADRMG